MEPMAIGVFASVGSGLGASLEAVRRLDVSTVQLGAPRTEQGRSDAPVLKRQFADAKITVTCIFCGFDGSSYETLECVERTVGLVPAATRADRLQQTFAMSDFADALQCAAIGMHLGVLPPDPGSQEYEEVVEATRAVCDHCARNGQRFHLETGQETAQELLGFIQRVERANLAVNFDPANMILYDKGDPIEAVGLLGPLIKSVHCKDATRRRRPEQKWYEDCPLGDGDVGMKQFLEALVSVGYRGPLTIEREYSPDQEKDLAGAVAYLQRLRSEVLAQL